MDRPGSHAKALQLLDAAVGDMRALSDAFQVFDADNDGKLTEDEVPSASAAKLLHASCELTRAALFFGARRCRNSAARRPRWPRQHSCGVDRAHSTNKCVAPRR